MELVDSIFLIIILYLTRSHSILFKIKPSDIRTVHEINSRKNVNRKWNGKFVSTSPINLLGIDNMKLCWNKYISAYELKYHSSLGYNCSEEHMVLSSVSVAVDGVWIGNWIY
jgi:hypothetical protein